jgi:hypothetical protein
MALGGPSHFLLNFRFASFILAKHTYHCSITKMLCLRSIPLGHLLHWLILISRMPIILIVRVMCKRYIWVLDMGIAKKATPYTLGHKPKKYSLVFKSILKKRHPRLLSWPKPWECSHGQTIKTGFMKNISTKSLGYPILLDNVIILMARGSRETNLRAFFWIFL